MITLLTDFGSFYPAQMKGVILQRTREVIFVDIAHDIPPQQVRMGAFALLASAPQFPPGTIHLAVVDPGVGTERRGLVVESGGHLFVGPDNGLLMPAARALGTPRAFSIPTPDCASSTFHGRDVFAPAAADLIFGREPESMGPAVEPVDLDFGVARRTERGLEAKVIFVDRFGNAVTNLREAPPFPVRLQGRSLVRARTYADAGPIEPLITLGSHGFAEIAVNGGRAADLFGLAPGDRILLEEESCSE
ncbi:MAG: SAM-dependent chlorinase/fluorinase [Methanosarcinales archaeon]|nr:SAM-dependent chlorinase/fluorinase [Methanosarcinales archaeon]